MAAKNGSPRPDNHVIVLFGAPGDLARRKLLPGLFHLFVAGCYQIGTVLPARRGGALPATSPASMPASRWPNSGPVSRWATHGAPSAGHSRSPARNLWGAKSLP